MRTGHHICGEELRMSTTFVVNAKKEGEMSDAIACRGCGDELYLNLECPRCHMPATCNATSTIDTPALDAAIERYDAGFAPDSSIVYALKEIRRLLGGKP